MLIVDDHPVVRDGLRGMFAGDQRFAVEGEAGDGNEALAVARSVHPDVVLMDLRMPGMDGVSQRELEVLTLISQGSTNRETAAKLFISEATVKTHLLHVYAKLGVRDRAAAVAAAFERGLLGG